MGCTSVCKLYSVVAYNVMWWEKGWNIAWIKEWQQYLIILRFPWIYRKIIIWLLSLCWIMNNKILKYEKVCFILHITMPCNSILVRIVYARQGHVGCGERGEKGYMEMKWKESFQQGKAWQLNNNEWHHKNIYKTCFIRMMIKEEMLKSCRSFLFPSYFERIIG